MSNTNFDNLAPVNFVPMIQKFLSARLVARGISKTEWQGLLDYGKQIDNPYIADPRVQTYTPGTDLTIDGQEAYSNTMDLDQSEASTFLVTPKERVQARDKSYAAKLANRQAYVLGAKVDYALLKEGVDNAANTVTGGAVTISNFLSKLTDCSAAVENEEAMDGTPFYVVDPDRRSLLTQIFVANGFKEGDVALRNGFMGKANGAMFFVSTNLPATVTLGMATQPTDGDTVTIKGVVFTFRTTADEAGEVARGANVAAAQANLRAAINGTGTGDGTDYFELDTRDRRKLQNKQVSCSAFSANVATITAAGKINGQETFTDTTDAFGTESISLLHGVKGAISLGMQIAPQLDIGVPPNRPMERNYVTHQLYGKKVFYRDTFRLCKLTVNA